MSWRSASLACLLVLLTSAPLYAQTAQPASAATPRRDRECLKGAVNDLKKIVPEPDSVEKSGKISRLLQRWPVYLCYMAADTEVTRALLGVAEEQRQDKQPGASGTSSGSTSLVNKGSSPWLLGFALEHGGLSQSSDGNTITFRGNVANSLKALMKNSYLASYEAGENDPLVQYLSKLSFGVSFNSAAPEASSAAGFSPSSSSLAGFSAKYEVVNHRDPRDKRWRARWHELSTTVGLDFTTSAGGLGDVLRANQKYDEWIGHARSALVNLPPGAEDGEIQKVLEDAAESFITSFGNNADVTNAIQRLSESISNYVKRENTVFSEIRATPVVTVQYDLTRQSLPGSQNVTAVQPNQSIPDLSDIMLVIERGFKGADAPELTFNAGGTWFNSNVSGRAAGRLRDYRASLQLDVPLKEIQNVGQPTLSFSGQFLSLLEEPLGQKVTLNGVTIDRRGNAGIFQAKLSIPVKDSGVKIPIAFTYANRTELIKEKDVRGNIGITFDLDSLFSKAK